MVTRDGVLATVDHLEALFRQLVGIASDALEEFSFPRQSR
jgi:hypothetical protein